MRSGCGRNPLMEPVRSLDAIHLATVETIDADPALVALAHGD